MLDRAAVSRHLRVGWTNPALHPQGRARNVPFLVDPMTTVECAEETLMPVHVLRTAEQEDAVGHERVVEGRNDDTLKVEVEIDEEVATRQQVDAGEWRITRQAVRRKGAELANRLRDRVTAVDPVDEMSRQPLGR